MFNDRLTKVIRFVSAVVSGSMRLELIRSYKSSEVGHRDFDCTVIEAARATSAAPPFFPPFKVEREGVTFLDGAFRENNPVEVVKSEAEKLWPNREIGCLLSIGTGVKLVPSLDLEKQRIHHLIDRMVKISIDADNKNSSFIDSNGRELMRLGKFFRFSVPQGLENVTMEELQKDGLMKDLTFAYMRDEFTRVEKCAAHLSNKRAARKQRGSHTWYV